MAYPVTGLKWNVFAQVIYIFSHSQEKDVI